MITTDRINIPNWFWEALQDRNRQKTSTDRTAIVIQSAMDYNQAFSDPILLCNLLVIAKTHYMFFEVAQSGSHTFINIMKNSLMTVNSGTLKRKFDLLIIQGHGDARSISMGVDSEFSIADIDNQAGILFSQSIHEVLEDHAAIVLNACETGLELAPKMASLAGSILVTGPFNSIGSTDSWLQYCPEDGIELRSCDAQIFRSDSRLSNCGHSNDLYESLLLVETYARSGSSELQYKLGQFYLKQKFFSTPLKVMPTYWFFHSVLNGIPQAQSIFAQFEKSLASPIDEAVAFKALVAATNGHEAQIKVAELYADHLYLPGALDQAIFWCGNAMEQGIPKAQQLFRILIEIKTRTPT